MSQPILKLKNITKRYPGSKNLALNNVSLDVQEGEVLALLGINGAGKTTLSSLIGTLHPCTEGTILFRGKPVMDNIIEYRKKVGFCAQSPNLDGVLNVEQNLTFAGKYFGVDKKILQGRVEKLIEFFDLQPYRTSAIDELSGGFKRRVLIAREMVHEPDIMILDEPTVALDPGVRKKIWEIIKQLKAVGKTVILTTHYIEEAEILADRVCILDAGKIKLIDTPENLKNLHSQAKLEEIFVKLTEEPG
ncbi:ABC transporter ATP-binding protein [bacterium]|jgi:ABC-2 type transport system ATP-binding protein|nr:ABC transporter ATP-binding protein [bacterium]